MVKLKEWEGNVTLKPRLLLNLGMTSSSGYARALSFLEYTCSATQCGTVMPMQLGDEISLRLRIATSRSAECDHDRTNPAHSLSRGGSQN